jgi:hypothetical protein
LFEKKRKYCAKKKEMLILILVALAIYWWFSVRKSGSVDLGSANPLDPDGVQLLVARVPHNYKNVTIQGDGSCEYDVFIDGDSVIDQPVFGGTVKLVRTRKLGQTDDLIVVQKKNITLQRAIAPSVVRFH